MASNAATRRLDGAVALITGATGGIGRATAARFVDEGARVVLADLDAEALSDLAAAFGPSAAWICADVTEEEQNRAAVALALERWSRIDIGVLNAGIEGRVAAIDELAPADFDRVIAVNVRGVFLGLAQLLPALRRGGGGAITITSSTAGLRGAAGLAAYTASKHAVIGLMKSAALEGAPHNIRVNTVNPAPVETRMMRSIEAGARPDDPDGAKTKFLTGIPLKRYGRPEEIAALIAFLSSDEASFCTGGIYTADGGTMAGGSR
ncbi:SDR family NAD(P)-dependent oxidoreductase [Chelatococcus reniformis]|uniref:Short-chain dehydrogenase n=1 Tax=Chelatococcus reniformis TaxID=1494448 RepID=A0A916UTL5_9HYPH|nr:SDR family oxidoreductase [Chelatococcus reniformis]GGC87613.1 short-chain dehydrogenase [Chelatococcus reniformis]